jgi:hypothetical protein
VDDPAMTDARRKGSREVWQTSYNADVNFAHFAQRLKIIGENKQ